MRVRVRIVMAMVLVLAMACGTSEDAGQDPGGADAVSDITELPNVPDVVADALPDAVPDVPALTGPVRFLHISDLHVYGDAVTPLTGPLQKAVDLLNALPGEVDFVAATGDYVDYLDDGLQPGDPSTFSATIDTLKGLRWPVRTMAGNHEYYRNSLLEPTKEKAARDAYLSAAMGHELDQVFDIRGVRFVVLNTMQGDTWASSNGLTAETSDAQLAWLRQQLAGGLPTVLLIHHPPTGESQTPTGDSLCQAIQDSPGVVKAVFAGHLHGFWKGDACGGVPYWLVANTDASKPFYFLVEVDGVTGAVTIVNEAEVPFGTVPTFTCDPATAGLAVPDAVVGTHQVIHVGHMVSNLPGLEGIEGDGLDKVPLVLRLDAWDAVTNEIQARLSQGLPEAGFIGVLDGAPCVPMVFDVAGPCASSRNVAFEMDLLPLLRAMLDVTPDPSWRARLEITGFRLEASLTATDGTPRFDKGLLHISASGLKALDDLRGILVSEYCGGRIVDCVPGATDMPACPTPADSAFFDQVPEACDVSVGTYSLRLVLGLLAAYPLDNVALIGEFTTEPRNAVAVPEAGALSDAMFSTAPGGNCEAPVVND
jgi:hypothetical protein